MAYLPAMLFNKLIKVYGAFPSEVIACWPLLSTQTYNCYLGQHLGPYITRVLYTALKPGVEATEVTTGVGYLLITVTDSILALMVYCP